MSSQLPESLKHLAKAKGLRGAPKVARAFSALTRDQRVIMKQKGFLPREIREFDSSTSIDFHSVHFQRMIRSRAKYVEAMKLNKWTGEEIQSRIGRFLRRKGASPWDWFRLEYATVSQRPTLSGSQFARFLQERRDVSRYMGRAYGRIQSVQKHFYRGLPGLPRKRS